MVKKYFTIMLVISLMVLVGSLVLVDGAGAQSSLKDKILINLDDAAFSLPSANITTVVARVIQGALGLLVIIFFILIILAGFRWMTAGGNEEIVAKAKKNIINAIIGVVIVIMAYAITVFIFNVMLGQV